MFENFRENSLKRGLSNDTTDNPPLFSLVNTFKVHCKKREKSGEKNTEVYWRNVDSLWYKLKKAEKLVKPFKKVSLYRRVREIKMT